MIKLQLLKEVDSTTVKHMELNNKVLPFFTINYRQAKSIANQLIN